MIAYYNFYLTNEIRTTTRERYTFLDALAFIGGIIDIVLIGFWVFFFIYRYRLHDLQVFLNIEKLRA